MISWGCGLHAVSGLYSLLAPRTYDPGPAILVLVSVIPDTLGTSTLTL
jgi:hypothetical protein